MSCSSKIPAFQDTFWFLFLISLLACQSHPSLLYLESPSFSCTTGFSLSLLQLFLSSQGQTEKELFERQAAAAPFMVSSVSQNRIPDSHKVSSLLRGATLLYKTICAFLKWAKAWRHLLTRIMGIKVGKNGFFLSRTGYTRWKYQ